MDFKSDILNLAVVNFRPEYKNKESNLLRIKDFTVAAAKRGADIILFPEMCLTGYGFYDDDNTDRAAKISLAETIPGPSTLSVAEITKRYGVYTVFGMPQKSDNQSDRLFNSAAVIGPEGVVGAYQKIHPYASENAWCVKGQTPFMFDTKWGPVGVGICYDTYHFPELMRYYASKGARLYLNPTAIIRDLREGGGTFFRSGYLPCLEYGVSSNEIFIATANLVGYEDKTFFGGGSVILGPKITPSAVTYCTAYAGGADCDQEGVLMATLDLSLARRKIFENNEYTGVPDYRPELYRSFK